MPKTTYQFTTFGILLQCSEKGIIQALHRSEMTDTKQFDGLVSRIAAIREEAERFLCSQERAGKISPYILGGNSEGEIYPEIKL